MICGHDRAPLRHMLLGSSGPVYNPAWEGPGCWEAHLAIHDPAKLAAIVAELMRGLGMRLGNGAKNGELVPFPAAYIYPCTDLIFVYVWTCRNPDGPKRIVRHESKKLTMSQARAFALRLLDATTTTAQDVERMIGEL